ncbi:MAG TPA: hypothetical protein VNR11_12350 [Xanthobacteraceae bacterium]|nr:hypothetical protein [Xanthobacteraceae bacterium]
MLALSIAAPDRCLAIPLANAASRYTPIFGKTARKVIDLMQELGLAVKVKGYPFRGPTTIQATGKLAKYLPMGKSDWNALRLEHEPRAIILTAADVAGPDEDEAFQEIARRTYPPDIGPWLDKVDAEMQAINAALRSARIECGNGRGAYLSERPDKPMAVLLTPHHRTLRRYFNGSWDRGGRLFGGFWQNMTRADRFRHLRIGGEPVALVDYGQLFLRLAYAEANIDPPKGDLYDLTGADATRPQWKELRNARKKMINALFFCTGPLKQWPGAGPRERAEMRNAFPPGTKPSHEIQAIKCKHAPIAALFESGHGHRFMRQESDLITVVVLALLKRGIIALPIHDAVLVAERHAAEARAVMENEAKRATGADIPASVETVAD